MSLQQIAYTLAGLVLAGVLFALAMELRQWWIARCERNARLARRRWRDAT